MQVLDVLQTPLTGSNLIEASAGTGKTHTIVGLYLRLLLESGLAPQQILVVTFTKAATAELKDRVRQKLIEAEDAFTRASSTDPILAALLNRIPQRETARRHLRHALVNFDRAAIFTIHGFCQRVLHENAFETARLFDLELALEPHKLIQTAADDYWRKTMVSSEPEVAAYILHRLKGPDALARLYGAQQGPTIRLIPDTKAPGLEGLNRYRASLAELREAWPGSRTAMRDILQSPALSSVIYGSLKPDPRTPATTPREHRVNALIQAMDRLVAGAGPGFPLFDGFEKLTAGKLRKSLKKGERLTFPAMADACDRVYNSALELEEALTHYLAYFKRQFLVETPAALERLKAALETQTYDDLLHRVAQALQMTGGDVLRQRLKRDYHAALVDEFQDTDRVQYAIIRQIFGDSRHPLFLIGDPKQAIYGFRGADLFTYLKASANAQRRYTLQTNYRTQPGLLQAINTLFSAVSLPFLLPSVEHVPIAAARQETGGAMHIWFFGAASTPPMTKTAATAKMSRAVAQEIGRLLTGPEDPVAASAIAVLVRTNRQARMIKQALSRANIPAVLFQAGNVFHSKEAIELERILNAIADPTCAPRVRAALATEMMGATASDLAPRQQEDDLVENQQVLFAAYLDRWQRRGFLPMVRKFMVEADVYPRMLAMTDGERRITNITHLSELLHHAQIEANMSVEELLKWFAFKRHSTAATDDTHQLRLESDLEAVKIITIHKAKGLEFDIVFCPFAWDDARPRSRDVLVYHDPKAGFAPVMNLTVSDRDGRRYTHNERLAEDLRLLYVALTRARRTCYVFTGNLRGMSTSALAYLVHSDGALDIGAHSQNDVLEQLERHVQQKEVDQLVADFQGLSEKTPGTLRLEIDPQISAKIPLPSDPADRKLAPRRFTGAIDRRWRIASFSMLTTDTHIGDSRADPPTDWDSVAALTRVDEDTAVEDPESIYAFPQGTRAGHFFHDLLEQLNFATQTREAWPRLVNDTLARHGFETEWRTTVLDLIEKVAEAQLPGASGPFSLAQVTQAHRWPEWAFYIPLNPISADALNSVYGSQFAREPSLPRSRFAFEPTRGFLRGFIDLICWVDNRYYIIDWKSNHLGTHAMRYHRDNLRKVMLAARYDFQAHVYTLALHQYLRWRDPGYDYEACFGGILYLFLRGINPVWGPDYGIYHEIPSGAAIAALGQRLIPDFRL